MSNIIIIGASSGIGKEIALQYGVSSHNKIGLLARRKDKLQELASQMNASVEFMRFDLEESNCGEQFLDFLRIFHSVDCIIYCSGFGEINPQLDWDLCERTLTVNVMAFTKITNVAYGFLKKQGYGHYAAIASVGGLRGAENDSGYSASKSYMIKYMEGMSRKSKKESAHIVFSTILPGFVDTQMAKGDKFFWMCSPKTAALQIVSGIIQKKRYLYITRRWKLIAWILQRIPNYIYERL